LRVGTRKRFGYRLRLVETAPASARRLVHLYCDCAQAKTKAKGIFSQQHAANLDSFHPKRVGFLTQHRSETCAVKLRWPVTNDPTKKQFAK
jgi:hypothetical protein